MQFSSATNSSEILDLMSGVLETAWTAAGVQIIGLSQVDRDAMATAISDAVIGGERRFLHLYRNAIDTLNAPPIEVRPVEVRLAKSAIFLEPPPPLIPLFALYPARTMAPCL
jgi:hypothetical protein